MVLTTDSVLVNLNEDGIEVNRALTQGDVEFDDKGRHIIQRVRRRFHGERIFEANDVYVESHGEMCGFTGCMKVLNGGAYSDDGVLYCGLDCAIDACD